MNKRLDYSKAAPGAIKTIIDMNSYCANCGLEHSLLELIKMRASQINIWNRFAITFADMPGSYLPDHPAAKRA